MKSFIINHDYVNNDWDNIINDVYQEIGGMTAAEVMAAFIERSRKLLLKEKAFIAVVSSGKFYLEPSRGELNWEFILPEKKPAVSGNFHEITISWKEFVERTEIGKEITIPYGDCGFETFIEVIRAEVPEWLANSMADDILAILDQKSIDTSDANKRQAIDTIESGEFNEKFMGFLRFGNSVDKFEYARAIESALVHTLNCYSEPIRRLFASGAFVYDMYEGEILFKVVGEEFKETDDDFRLKVIVREVDDLGLPYASYEVKSTFNM